MSLPARDMMAAREARQGNVRRSAARGTTRFGTRGRRPFARLRAIAKPAALCWLLAAAPAPASQTDRQFRDFVRDTWSLEAGLPQRSVTAIAQGPRGYLWVATQHALARFDGVRFQHYTTLDEPALPGNDISTLFQTSDGSLWIGSYKGLARYDGRSFEAIPGPEAEGRGLVDVSVRTMTEDPAGRLVAGGADGLFRVENGRLVPMELPSPGPIGGLYGEGEVMWVGGIGRFWRYEQGMAVAEHALPANFESARVNGFQRHDGELWIATSAGLFRHANGKLLAYDAPSASGPVNALLTDSGDTLWVGTDAALLRIRAGRMVESIDDQHPAGHPQIRSMHEDHEGNLWLGSSIDGLARYWSGWVDRFSEASGLSTPLVWSVADAGDGALWVGTSDGLFRLADDRYAEIVPGRELPHPHAYTLQPDGEDLWIGTRGGLVVLNTANGELGRPEVLATLDAKQINGIVPAGMHGRYFFATAQGLYLWDGENRLERIPELGNHLIRQVQVFDDGELIVATDGGAYRGSRDRLTALPVAPPALKEAHFVTVDELASGHLVLSTLDSGLLFGHAERLILLTTAEGLPSNSSYFVVDDEHGHLWVAGYEGLYRIAIAELEAFAGGTASAVEAEMLLSESGRHRGSQQGYCCNGAGHAKGLLRADGLWLPTRDGVVRIRPDRLQRNAISPRVLIERYRADEQWHEVDGGRIPQLPRGARDLAFEFTALSFRDPSSVQIRYRLEGYEENWQPLDAGMPRMTGYTNLPPGDYRFEVTAANNAGVWAEHPASLDFRIPARVHETASFRVLAVALTMLLLIAGYRWRRHQWSVQQANLRSQVRKRTEQLRLANDRLMNANRALRDLSTIDTLTGLRNRRYLYEQMSEEPRRLDRLRARVPEQDLVLGFALIDVDHFKQVNDEHGHHAGDRVLEQVGERLLAIARKGDHVVRWGGEEFLVVLQGVPRADSAAALERLSNAVGEGAYRINERKDLTVTCSIGYAELPPRATDPVHAIDWEAVVEMADQALYRVKQTGRNGWAILRPASGTDLGTITHAGRGAMDDALHDNRVILISGKVSDTS
jgi:diguanylate cyclase (GGDEF)-like protein